MSASREKKFRQNLVDERNEKKLKAAQEAAAAKRKSILYTLIGVVCAAVVIALLVWNTGFFQGRVAAVKVGDQVGTVAELQYYYNMKYSDMAGSDDASIYGFDTTKSPAEQIQDESTGATWHDYFLNAAVDQLAEDKILAAKAKTEGITLTKEEKQMIQDTVNSLSSYAASMGYSTTAFLKMNYGESMTLGLYKDLMTEAALAEKMRTSYQQTLNYSDEELEASYAEFADDYDLFSYAWAEFLGAPEAQLDEEGNVVEPTDKEKGDAEAHAYLKAQELEQALKAGGQFDQLMAEHAENASVKSQSVTKQQGVYGLPEESMGSWVRDPARQVGEVYLVKANENCYVIQFLGRERDMTWSSGDVRHILVAAEQNEGAAEPTAEQYAAAEAKANQLLADWEAAGATEESFAELAKKESADPGSAENGGLYEGVSSANFIKGFADWATAAERQVGDTGLVQNTESSVKGWHIMYYCGTKGMPVWKQTMNDIKVAEDMAIWEIGIVSSVTVEKLPGIANIK